MWVGVAEEEATRHSARQKPRNSSYLTSRFKALSSNGFIRHAMRLSVRMVDNWGSLI